MAQYSWNDILELTDLDLQERLMPAPDNLIALAISGDKSPVKNKILRNISKRRRDSVDDISAQEQDLAESNIKAARRGLIKIIFNVETDYAKESGKIDEKAADSGKSRKSPPREKEEPEKPEDEPGAPVDGKRVFSALEKISPYIKKLEIEHESQAGKTLIDFYMQDGPEAKIKKPFKSGKNKRINEKQARYILDAFYKKTGIKPEEDAEKK